MSDKIRAILICGGVGALVAGMLASPVLFPQAFADEPQSHVLDTATDIFPAPFNPSGLKKFAITFDDSVSTEVQHADTVRKLAFGHKSVVSIVTTPSGTYSSDGLASPHVIYPGIDVAPAEPVEPSWLSGDVHAPSIHGHWTSFTTGSFTYFSFTLDPVAHI